MENSNNPQTGIGEFWTSTQGDDKKADYLFFWYESNTWTRTEQGDAKEWAVFAFPNGQEEQRRYEKEHMPQMVRDTDLDWRKTIRPVRK